MNSPELRAALPEPDVSPQELVSAESEFFVGVRDTDAYGYAGPALASLQGFDAATLGQPGCAEYGATSFTPEIDLAVGQGVEIGVRSESSQIKTTLSRDGIAGPVREWNVTPGTALHIASSAKDASVAIRFNVGGTFVICHGG